MFVTPDYYYGYIGGFITGALTATIVCLLKFQENDDLEDSFSEDENNDKEESDQLSEDEALENVFYFKLSNSSVKAILRGEEVIDKFSTKSDVSIEKEYECDALESEIKTHVPVNVPNFKPRGYATFDELENAVKRCKTNDSEEQNIITSFRDLIGKNYYDARNIAIERDFSLYPIYVGMKKMKEPEYFADQLGVRIKDEELSYYSDGTPRPSMNAIITEIIDVGGNDRNGKGSINL